MSKYLVKGNRTSESEAIQRENWSWPPSRFLSEGRTPEYEAALSALSLLMSKDGGDGLVDRAYGEAIWRTQLEYFKRSWKAIQSDEYPCLHTIVGKRHPKGVLTHECDLPCSDHSSLWRTEQGEFLLATQPYGPIRPDGMARLLDVAAKWGVQIKIEAGSWWFPGRTFLIVAYRRDWMDTEVERMTGQRPSWTDTAPAGPRQATRAVPALGYEGLPAENDLPLMERHLQDLLSKNLQFIEPGLRPAEWGLEQYRTDIGIIDLLCRDSQNNIVVVELKARDVGDSVIGQIAGYMRCVRETLAKDVSVRGIVVCRDCTERVLAAAKEIPGLSVKRFGLRLWIQAAG